MSTTTDLSKFGQIELRDLEVLLRAMREQGLPKDFDGSEVYPVFNQNSGNVFLSNQDYQVAMMNGDKLESFYSCPECGHEGFMEDMEHEGNEGCEEYLDSIKSTEVTNA